MPQQGELIPHIAQEGNMSLEAHPREFNVNLFLQGVSGTEPEPETGTVRTVFPETESETAGTVFPGTETGTGTVLSFKNVLKHRKTLF